MNGKQILNVLDRAVINSDLDTDCRRLMQNEANTVRSCIELLDSAKQALSSEAKKPHQGFDAKVRQARLAQDVEDRDHRVRLAIIEAERTARLWSVI